MLYQLLRELDKQTEISNFSTEYLQQEIERRKKAEMSVVSRKMQMKNKLDEMLNIPYEIDGCSTPTAAYVNFDHEGMKGTAYIKLTKGEFFNAP